MSRAMLDCASVAILIWLLVPGAFIGRALSDEATPAPAATNPSANKSAPPELAAIALAAKAVFDNASRNDWDRARHEVAVVARNWEVYLAENKLPGHLIVAMMEAVDRLQEASAISEEDRINTMRTANDVGWAVLDLIDLYHPAIPTDIGRLDVLERRFIVDLLSGDFIAAKETMDRLKAVWKGLRPSVVERAGAEAAASFDARLPPQEKAVVDKSARAGEREARKGLEVVSDLEEAFRHTRIGSK